jgi:hypothetical protein
MTYSKLPDKTFETVEAGIYIFEIEDLIEDESTDGGSRIVMSHKFVNMDKKLNYDNYSLVDSEGKIKTFGANKLKTLLDAVAVKIEVINTPTLKALLPGKFFKANIIINDKGYPQINFADIYPVSAEKTALNETSETAPVTEDLENVFTQGDKKIDEDDI